MGVESISHLKRSEQEGYKHKCGVLFLYGARDKTLDYIEKAQPHLEHRGQNGYGNVFVDEDGNYKLFKKMSDGTNYLDSPEIVAMRSFDAEYAGGHAWWNTAGELVESNMQPMVTYNSQHERTIIIEHNGQFSETGSEAEGLSDSRIFLNELAAAEGKDIQEAILNAWKEKTGAASLVVIVPPDKEKNEEGFALLMRDVLGVRPFWFAHIQDNSGVVLAASETSPIEAVGVEKEDCIEILPGQILRVDSHGVREIEIDYNYRPKNSGYCSFENTYGHDPDSLAFIPPESRNEINRYWTVEQVRYQMGYMLGLEHPIRPDEVDFVVSVPDTSDPMAIGYSDATGVPLFKQGLEEHLEVVQNQNGKVLVSERGYMTGNDGTKDEEVINSEIKQVNNAKFSYKEGLRGKKIVLVDDSLVKGNTASPLAEKAKNHGITAVHLRIANEMIKHKCHLATNMNGSLAADKAVNESQKPMTQYEEYLWRIEAIRKMIGNVDSLAFLSVPGMKQAMTGDPNAKGYCFGCNFGQIPPIDKFGNPLPQESTVIYQAAGD